MQFLAMESPRQTGHVCGLAIVDPSTRPSGRLEVEDLLELVTERLPLLPPFRWRLKAVPLGLDLPYWIDDVDFDIEYHVRDLAIAPPASDVKLGELVARIASRPLDRTRPLWEMYLIHGLPHGRAAVMTKIHHAVVDGMSGAEIMAVILDTSPEGREPPPASALGAGSREPSGAEMLARGAIGMPRYVARALTSLPVALPNLEHIPGVQDVPGARTISQVMRTLSGKGPSRVLERTNLPRPKTSFNDRVSPHRRFAFGRLELRDVKHVKNAYGCTVNDVVVSICAGAVRRWLLDHGELPDEPLVAMVPVSVRTKEQFGTFGNRVGVISAPLFTNVADPVQRLHETHDALKGAKDRHKALPASLLQDGTQFIPPAVFARAARVTMSLTATRPIWNLIISNVPGPAVPLYLAGARLEANYPVSVITDGTGLNITVMSYCGKLDFGIVADREQMPDVWKLIDWLGESLRELQHPGASEPAPDEVGLGAE
jgi:WS/DGAT/MGAT family acyltransferase